LTCFQIILAIYYCLVDIVLLGQFFWYEGFRFTDKIERRTTGASDSPDERSRLLNGNGNASSNSLAVPSNGELSRSPSSQRLADGANYSPATPFATEEDRSRAIKRAFTDPSPLVAAVYNIFAVIIVCAAGVLGWWLSNRTHRGHHTAHNPPSDEPTGAEALQFNVLGQVFGYICAVLYLGSRIPQLLLNYRRKSTDGISMLFFVFACVGNLTYVLSIFAYSPVCAAPQHCQPGEQKEIYLKYITVNLSWFIGSFGTLVLDMGVFIQFFLYGKGDQALSDENESAVT